MRIIICFLAICFVACSTPKNTYYFDYANYHEGSKALAGNKSNAFELNSESIAASNLPDLSVVTPVRPTHQDESFNKPSAVKKSSLIKEKQSKKIIKQELKSLGKTLKSNRSHPKDSGISQISNTNDSSKNGFAIAGFVCSIVSWFVLWPLAILGIIFSAIGLKSERKGLAIAGLVLGIVGIVLVLVVSSQV